MVLVNSLISRKSLNFLQGEYRKEHNILIMSDLKKVKTEIKLSILQLLMLFCWMYVLSLIPSLNIQTDFKRIQCIITGQIYTLDNYPVKIPRFFLNKCCCSATSKSWLPSDSVASQFAAHLLALSTIPEAGDSSSSSGTVRCQG